MGFFKRTFGLLNTIRRTSDKEMTPEQEKSELRQLLFYVGIFLILFLGTTMIRRCNPQLDTPPSYIDNFDPFSYFLNDSTTTQSDTTTIDTLCRQSPEPPTE